MESLEFAVPYNQDPETLKEIFKLKNWHGNKIREIYLSGPQEYAGSGRITNKTKLSQTIELVDQIHNEGIRVNLTLNSTCEGPEWYSPEVVKALLEYIQKMHGKHGVESVTIANPLHLQVVRNNLPDIEICASVLSDIDCLQRAALYSKWGANVITPDANINRDLNLLKEIKETTNLELRLMVNEGCLYKCPFRKFHFNYISHQSLEPDKESALSGPFFGQCQLVTRKDPSQILKSGWVRPEDIRKYSGIVKYFKIVGRARPKSMVLRTIKAYMEESWDGDLLDIQSSSLGQFGLHELAYLDNKSLDKYGFFKKITSCDKHCVGCNYCEELASKLVSMDVLTRGKLEDIGRKDVADVLEREGKLPWHKHGMHLSFQQYSTHSSQG